MVARHRNFDNMDINGQLDDDEALSDGGDDYISPEHQALLNDGLDRVRETIGDEDNTGLSDTAIKGFLWNCYFDIEKTVQWAIEEQERAHEAQQRKVPSYAMKDLPPLPPSDQTELSYSEYPPPVLNPRHDIEEDAGETKERSRVPLIKQAQHGYDSLELEAEASDAPVKRNLSTISERTERTVTDVSPNWIPRQQYMSLSILRPPSSVTTSYGRASVPLDTTINSLDPDTIPVSPSGSALHRLSFYEAPPSMPPSEADSYESHPSPKAPSEPLPPIDTIPDIPDLNSRSSRNVPPKPASQAPKKSKLAMLASNRASTSSTRSESSRSTGTDVAGSVKTYPDLRPTSQSIRPPSSVISESASVPTSTASHIRRAVATAMQLEAGDRDPSPSLNESRTSTPKPIQTPNRPSAPTPSKIPEMPSPSTSPPTARQHSKLALLAQANKAARISKPKPLTSPPVLPLEHTEYLTPIANGSAVTTAITTSYQSLYSLTNPDRSTGTTPFVVVPLPATITTHAPSPADAKKTKLAMKIKRGQEKQQPQRMPEAPAPSIPPMFLPKATRTRASPSSFASLLVDDVSSSEVGGPYARRTAKQTKEKQSEQRPRHGSRQKHSEEFPEFFVPSGSAFDGPSPDDVVLNARRDTSLAQMRTGTASTSVTKSSTSGS
ncbi:hypothetical protein GGX14DRAFT_346787 [Mycena pura]|uniref:HBS1-like protein N-terminal domain-containing protein n=1 Tax=Mycena pura TaxID=153505 RepID=A0AAD7E4X9_9AGAR|nr:hypothetical protein GGX14DRAFT_346787 [Mycena pura]